MDCYGKKDVPLFFLPKLPPIKKGQQRKVQHDSMPLEWRKLMCEGHIRYTMGIPEKHTRKLRGIPSS